MLTAEPSMVNGIVNVQSAGAPHLAFFIIAPRIR
jgi:hypothetical protein